jgi:hypothetical protein
MSVSSLRQNIEKPVEGRIAFEDDPTKKGQGRAKQDRVADEGWRVPLVPGLTEASDRTVTCEPVHVYQIPHVVGGEVVWLPWRVEGAVRQVDVLEDGFVTVRDCHGVSHKIPTPHVLTVYPA